MHRCLCWVCRTKVFLPARWASPRGRDGKWKLWIGGRWTDCWKQVQPSQSWRNNFPVCVVTNEQMSRAVIMEVIVLLWRRNELIWWVMKADSTKQDEVKAKHWRRNKIMIYNTAIKKKIKPFFFLDQILRKQLLNTERFNYFFWKNIRIKVSLVNLH